MEGSGTGWGGERTPQSTEGGEGLEERKEARSQELWQKRGKGRGRGCVNKGGDGAGEQEGREKLEGMGQVWLGYKARPPGEARWHKSGRCCTPEVAAQQGWERRSPSWKAPYPLG